MLEYQKQNSSQTLSQGIEEYLAANHSQLMTRASSSQADEFFRCHDVCHIVFGCGISLNDEMVVKIHSFLGTTEGWAALRGYRLPESKEVYQDIRFLDVILASVSALYLVPRTIWRCSRMRRRWPWNNFDAFLHIPLSQLRAQFNIRVAHPPA